MGLHLPTRWGRIGWSVNIQCVSQLGSAFLSMAIAISMQPPAHAAERVVLSYREAQVTLAYNEIETFAMTGDRSDELQTFFDQALVSPELVRETLTRTIPDADIPLTPSDVEFIAIQLSRLMGEPLGRDSREPLQAALEAAYFDREANFLELIAAYPKPLVRVDLNRIEQLQTDLQLFVTRISPLLGIIRGLLPELVCDCDPGLPQPSEPNNSEPNAADLEATANGAIRRKSTRKAIAPSSFDSIDLAFEHAQIAPTSAGQDTISIVTPQVSRRVMIDLGPIRPSFSIRGLTVFAETGRTSPGWGFYLNIANLNRDELRDILNAEVAIDLKFLDGILNSLLGEYLLFQVSKIVHTPSQQADIQALRSALILAAADDGRLSILDVLQHYPSEIILVEGINLARLAGNLQQDGAVRTVTTNLESLLLEFQQSTAQEICECQS